MNAPTTDLIVTWPSNCDYPMWRRFLHYNRRRFENVVVAFMDTHTGTNYIDFVISQMRNDRITFITPTALERSDWRDDALHKALKYCSSEWVWFTEQDFLITKREEFWHDVYTYQKHIKTGAVGVYQGDRLHPCCLFIQRSILDSIKPDFGIVAGKLDHFGLVAQALGKRRVRIGKLDEATYFHYNGLSHNWRLVSEGQPPVYEAKRFITYLRRVVNSGIYLHPEFERVAQNAIQAYFRTQNTDAEMRKKPE